MHTIECVDEYRGNVDDSVLSENTLLDEGVEK